MIRIHSLPMDCRCRRVLCCAVNNTNTTDILQSTAQRTSATIEPEFLSLALAEKMYSLKRGHLNALILKGRIKSVSLRERGTARGRRLIFHDSLRSFIFSHEVTTPGESDA